MGDSVLTTYEGQSLRAQLVQPVSTGLPASLGPKTAAGSLSVVPSTDQNPIFDHANSTKSSVTTSAIIITPPAGCDFIRISADVDIFVNTANAAATDGATGGGIRIVANQPEIIPVTATVPVYALSSSGTAVVRCTPMKVR